MTKSSKTTANYVDHPVGGDHCSQCTMFRAPHGCTSVEGSIAPQGHCSYYEAKKSMHPTASALRLAASLTDRSPSEAAKAAGNYQKGKLPWHGLTIAIENPKGSERSGVDKGGKTWRVKMPATYGYVLGSRGADKDHVDVYVGDAHDARTVYVIDQVDARTGRFDEHKCMLDFADKDAALLTYGRAFSDGKAKDRIGSVTEMSIPEFKGWANSSAAKKPLGNLNRGADIVVSSVHDLHRRGRRIVLGDLANSLDAAAHVAVKRVLHREALNLLADQKCVKVDAPF